MAGERCVLPYDQTLEPADPSFEAGMVARGADWVTRRLWLCLVIAAAIILVLPLFLVDVPPIVDYPNHLARLVVLAKGAEDPILSRFYAPHWGIIPNLAIDLVGPPLLRLLPVYVAGRLILGAVLLLSMASILVYNRVLFGRRLLWPIGSALITCNGLFLMGFLNCLISMGLALLVCAAWIAGRLKYPVQTSLLCAAGTVAIFFSHFFGVMFLAILMASHEAADHFARFRRGGDVWPNVKSTILVIVVLSPAVLLMRLSAFNDAASPAEWLPLTSKLIGLLIPTLNYDARLDLLTYVLVLVLAGLFVVFGHWKMPASTRVAILVLLSLYAVTPFVAKGGAWIDSRFSLAVGFMLFAGCTPYRLPRRAGVIILLAMMALVTIRGGVVASVWADHNLDLTELRQSIADVAPGTRVLVVAISPRDDPQFWLDAPRNRVISGMTTAEIHDAALILIERRAFWPLLFANPAQQPIMVQPAFKAISTQTGFPPDYRSLLTTPATRALDNAPYLKGWQSTFDDVLVLDAEGVPNLAVALPNVLTAVSNTGFAALYRIHSPQRNTINPSDAQR